MALLKKFLSAALAVAVFCVGGVAHAEIITYSFTADITTDSDSTDVIGVNVGDIVSGTFSYDSEADSNERSFFSVDVAYRDTGDIETDAVAIEGGSDGLRLDGTTIVDSDRWDIDRLQVADSQRNTQVTNLATGETVDARYAVQSVTLYLGDADAINGTDLPESLDLADFDGARYVVQVGLAGGGVAYAVGTISSLSRVDASAVPELSAGSAASSLTLVIGGAYVLTQRRRRGAAA